MARGRSTTYQPCLNLRLLLSRGNQQQLQEIANELMAALSTHEQRQAQTLVTITNLYLRDLLDRDHIVDILCNILKQPVNALTSAVLLALYSVVTSYDSIPPQVMRQVDTSIQAFARPAQQSQLLSLEHLLLTAVMLRRITPTRPSTQLSPAQKTPEECATSLHALAQLDRLTKPQVEEILQACIDTRELSQDKRKEVDARSVQQVAWRLLSQPFTMEEETLSVVVQALDDNEAIVCAAAALLLKSSKTLPQRIRKEAAQKSMQLLADDELSRRPLDTPDYYAWRLDDVLFETLQVLAE